MLRKKIPQDFWNILAAFFRSFYTRSAILKAEKALGRACKLRWICTYDPQSVKFDNFMEVLDKIAPVFADVWMKKVWKCSVLTI